MENSNTANIIQSINIPYDTIKPYATILLLLVVGMILVKIVKKLDTKILAKTKIEPIAYEFIQQIVKAVIWICILLACASQLGIQLSSILTILAAAGAAIALAVQDSLSNLFGGFIVMASDIVAKGDYISIENIEGVVDSISLLHTTVITPDKKTVTIPNATLNKSNILNYSKFGYRRMDISIGIDYSSDIDAAREAIVALAKKDNRVLKNPQPFCNVESYDDSAVTLSLKVFVKHEDYWNVNFFIQNNMKKVLDDAGISIPYPHMDVNITNR